MKYQQFLQKLYFEVMRSLLLLLTYREGLKRNHEKDRVAITLLYLQFSTEYCIWCVIDPVKKNHDFLLVNHYSIDSISKPN